MGLRLKQFRIDANLTRKELATRASLGESTVQAIEQGRHFGNPDTHKKLAQALGITVAKLVYGEEEMAPARSLPIPNEITPEQYRFIQALVRFFVAENEGRIPAEGLPTSPEAERRTREIAENGEIEEEINMTVL